MYIYYWDLSIVYLFRHNVWRCWWYLQVALGTVTNVDEAVRWLSYSYLYVRLTINPLVYGVPYKSVEEDPTLTQYRTELISAAGRKLDKARMVRFDERTGYFASTDQGRIASHFYIKYDTVEVRSFFTEVLKHIQRKFVLKNILFFSFCKMSNIV